MTSYTTGASSCGLNGRTWSSRATLVSTSINYYGLSEGNPLHLRSRSQYIESFALRKYNAHSNCSVISMPSAQEDKADSGQSTASKPKTSQSSKDWNDTAEGSNRQHLESREAKTKRHKPDLGRQPFHTAGYSRRIVHLEVSRKNIKPGEKATKIMRWIACRQPCTFNAY